MLAKHRNPWWLGLLLGLWPVASAGQDVPTMQSGADQRQEVAITVYNQNFGLVRERRTLPLTRGVVALEYGDVASGIQPETVHINEIMVRPSQPLQMPGMNLPA